MQLHADGTVAVPGREASGEAAAEVPPLQLSLNRLSDGSILVVKVKPGTLADKLLYAYCDRVRNSFNSATCGQSQ